MVDAPICKFTSEIVDDQPGDLTQYPVETHAPDIDWNILPNIDNCPTLFNSNSNEFDKNNNDNEINVPLDQIAVADPFFQLSTLRPCSTRSTHPSSKVSVDIIAGILESISEMIEKVKTEDLPERRQKLLNEIQYYIETSKQGMNMNDTDSIFGNEKPITILPIKQQGNINHKLNPKGQESDPTTLRGPDKHHLQGNIQEQQRPDKINRSSKIATKIIDQRPSNLLELFQHVAFKTHNKDNIENWGDDQGVPMKTHNLVGGEAPHNSKDTASAISSLFPTTTALSLPVISPNLPFTDKHGTTRLNGVSQVSPLTPLAPRKTREQPISLECTSFSSSISIPASLISPSPSSPQSISPPSLSPSSSSLGHQTLKSSKDNFQSNTSFNSDATKSTSTSSTPTATLPGMGSDQVSDELLQRNETKHEHFFQRCFPFYRKQYQHSVYNRPLLSTKPQNYTRTKNSLTAISPNGKLFVLVAPKSWAVYAIESNFNSAPRFVCGGLSNGEYGLISTEKSTSKKKKTIINNPSKGVSPLRKYTNFDNDEGTLPEDWEHRFVSMSDRHLVIAGSLGIIRVYDLSELGKRVYKYKSTLDIKSLIISARGNIFATGVSGVNKITNSAKSMIVLHNINPEGFKNNTAPTGTSSSTSLSLSSTKPTKKQNPIFTVTFSIPYSDTVSTLSFSDDERLICCSTTPTPRFLIINITSPLTPRLVMKSTRRLSTSSLTSESVSDRFQHSGSNSNKNASLSPPAFSGVAAPSVSSYQFNQNTTPSSEGITSVQFFPSKAPCPIYARGLVAVTSVAPHQPPLILRPNISQSSTKSSTSQPTLLARIDHVGHNIHRMAISPRGDAVAFLDRNGLVYVVVQDNADWNTFTPMSSPSQFHSVLQTSPPSCLNISPSPAPPWSETTRVLPNTERIDSGMDNGSKFFRFTTSSFTSGPAAISTSFNKTKLVDSRTTCQPCNHPHSYITTPHTASYEKKKKIVIVTEVAAGQSLNLAASLRWTPDGRNLLVVDRKGVLHLEDWASGLPGWAGVDKCRAL
ncbi:hypothetical protein NADFUDRAFT_48751 [Nadsonia fulvescens var. elongata DSM 6958]|uniref:WD40 repeat-like protein n=1 Tax=Nadsonia fulvescens var. elongata DSM 6958 TaxID=857566 RepID=A0A1E3PRP8_9ASCO|nr:hypothetical protein NADFUDRAFT_48751 [Nadsonia fulvescens var. elongata DSM 6958]